MIIQFFMNEKKTVHKNIMSPNLYNNNAKSVYF